MSLFTRKSYQDRKQIFYRDLWLWWKMFTSFLHMEITWNTSNNFDLSYGYFNICYNAKSRILLDVFWSLTILSKREISKEKMFYFFILHVLNEPLCIYKYLIILKNVLYKYHGTDYSYVNISLHVSLIRTVLISWLKS